MRPTGHKGPGYRAGRPPRIPMLIDAHLHVWRARPDFPRPDITTVSPASDVPLALWRQYMAEHRIERAVLVQPLYPGEDNSYVADCAADDPAHLAAVCV